MQADRPRVSRTRPMLTPDNFAAHGAEPGETPMAWIQRWIRRRMPQFGGRSAAIADRVLIVLAKTGAGKSTTMPVEIFRILRSERTPPAARFRGPGVLCTQPRVLTAIDLARSVSTARTVEGVRVGNPDMVLGLTCGYQTGPVSEAPPSGLVFATAGVLAAQLRWSEDAEMMARYQVIIVDEAHERSLDTDLTMYLLRNFYVRNAGNPRLPFLVLTSATFRPDHYARYFGVGPENVVTVEGRLHGITTHWPPRGANDYVAAAAERVLQIHEDFADDPPARADVLVFLPGAAEMQGVAKALEAALASRPALAARPFLVLSLNSEVVGSQSGDYRLAFMAPGDLPRVGPASARPARRVILSTVVAETGVTIDTLRHVVDCGWSRALETYYPENVQGLVTRPAARTRVTQRAGRAGRLFPGDFHPLYTENVYEALDADQLPEIVTQGLGGSLLALVQEQQRQKLRTGALPEFRVEDVGLLDPPPAEAYLSAAAAAVAMGFLSPRAPLPGRWPPAMLEEARADEPGAGPLAQARGYGLTSLGFLAAGFHRTSPEGVRALLEGYARGVAASDLITLAALSAGPGLGPADLLARRPAGPAGGLPPDAEALFASLPAFLATREVDPEGAAPRRAQGGGAAPRRLDQLPPLEGEYYYYRAKLLLADSFAEAVLVFDAFAAQLEQAGAPLPCAVSWCELKGLRFSALAELARRRALVAEELALAGLDPYRLAGRRLSALPAREFTDGLARFKRCIYSGYRARLLRFDPERGGYYSAQGVRVRAPDLLAPALAARLRALGAASAEFAPPRWLVTDRLRLVPAARGPQDQTKPLLWAVEAAHYSVLDGYVSPDPDFDAPREAPPEPAGLDPRCLTPDAGTLRGVHGPEGDVPSAAEAAEQLLAYDRVVGAALAARDGEAGAPVQKLSDYLRAVLFAPRQQEVLITTPLGGKSVLCAAAPLGEKGGERAPVSDGREVVAPGGPVPA